MLREYSSMLEDLDLLNLDEYEFNIFIFGFFEYISKNASMKQKRDVFLYMMNGLRNVESLMKEPCVLSEAQSTFIEKFEEAFKNNEPN